MFRSADIRSFLSGSALSEPAKFAVLLLAVHLFWKYTFSDGPAGMVFFFNTDVTFLFAPLTKHLTRVVGWLLQHSACPVVVNGSRLVSLADMETIRVVWSCTGVKQMLMMTLILSAAAGPWRHKAWYLPVSLALMSVFNVLRIYLISLLTFRGLLAFEWAHTGGKYVYYAFIFLLWWLWQEKIVTHESDC
ncbi:MAG: exosortase/archaeosortase family protein [Paludibacteraceae bacterium]|nr:exosortase/archaeosortase family protein [Paludibacteraceae bacterium]